MSSGRPIQSQFREIPSVAKVSLFARLAIPGGLILSLNPRTIWYLDRLVELGVYGNNRTEARIAVYDHCKLLIAEGKLMKEISDILHMTTRTVAFHKYRIMEVLGVRSNADLVRYAVRTHMVAS